jgi:hypothetical protein
MLSWITSLESEEELNFGEGGNCKQIYFLLKYELRFGLRSDQLQFFYNNDIHVCATRGCSKHNILMLLLVLSYLYNILYEVIFKFA